MCASVCPSISFKLWTPEAKVAKFVYRNIVYTHHALMSCAPFHMDLSMFQQFMEIWKCQKLWCIWNQQDFDFEPIESRKNNSFVEDLYGCLDQLEYKAIITFISYFSVICEADTDWMSGMQKKHTHTYCISLVTYCANYLVGLNIAESILLPKFYSYTRVMWNCSYFFCSLNCMQCCQLIHCCALSLLAAYAYCLCC